MATSSGSGGKSEAGYDCTFLSEVPDALVCIICLCPARNPHQISCCGRVFCKFCLDKHQSTCTSACPNCREKGGTGFRDIRGERHILSCKVKCTHSDEGCSWVGELKAMEEHMKKCSATVVACPYAAVGCDAKLPKTKLEEHKSSVDHLEMAVKKIAMLSDQLKPAKEEKNLPPVVFKMEHFEEHQDDDLVWNSPPFYTHPKGYKLYLKVYANGSEDVEGEYLSIFVCLMHGEYDDNLIWPFRGVINFEVLSQDSDSGHKEGTAKFLERKSSQKNRRVAAEERRDVGWGVPKLLLIGHSFVEDTVDEYVSNDCLYVRISEISVSEQNKPWLI